MYWNFLFFFPPQKSYFPPFYRWVVFQVILELLLGTYLPRVTWVHPSSSSSSSSSSSLLLGWSPVSVLCVFVVAGVVAGIVAFEVGVVFIVVVVVVVTAVDADDAVVDADDAITVVLLLLVVF